MTEAFASAHAPPRAILAPVALDDLDATVVVDAAGQLALPLGAIVIVAGIAPLAQLPPTSSPAAAARGDP